MPFVTDAGWSPATYRKALQAWQVNAPKRETEIQPRKASTKKPRHAELSTKLRSLLTWRLMHAGEDWTTIAVNDNLEPGEQPNLDCTNEVRPRPSEIMAAIGDDVEFAEIAEPRLGGGGPRTTIAVGGDIERGKVYKQDTAKPDCLTRMGRLHFSNGEQRERALVLDVTGKAVWGSVRLPLGALVKIGNHRPKDYFRKPKGAANDNTPRTVQPSLSASAPAVDFVDPVADEQERTRVRNAVGRKHAAVLDHALTASSFAEIGERIGYSGKTAERRGKLAVIDACEILQKELAA